MNLSDLPLITQDLPKAKNIYDWVVNRNFLSWKIYDNCNKEDNIRFKFTTFDINPEMPEDCEYVKATYKKDFLDAAFIFNDYHFLKEFNHFIKRF